MAKRLLRKPEVVAKTGLKSSALYEAMDAEDEEQRFPAPVPIGARAVAWVEDEVDAWIDRRIAQRKARQKLNPRPKYRGGAIAAAAA
jgi:prophage regulatory protein